MFQDMTGMLDSLLLHTKTGQTLHLWASLNKMVEHAACLVRDCAKLGSAAYNLLLNACPAATLGLAPRRVQVTVVEAQRLVHIRVIDIGRGVPASIRQTLFQPFVSTEKVNGNRSWARDRRLHRERAWRL